MRPSTTLVSQATPLNLREKRGDHAYIELLFTKYVTDNHKLCTVQLCSYIYLRVRVGIITKQQNTIFQNCVPDQSHNSYTWSPDPHSPWDWGVWPVRLLPHYVRSQMKLHKPTYKQNPWNAETSLFRKADTTYSPNSINPTQNSPIKQTLQQQIWSYTTRGVVKSGIPLYMYYKNTQSLIQHPYRSTGTVFMQQFKLYFALLTTV